MALGDNSRCRSSVVCCGGAKFCSGVEGVPTAAAAAHGWVSLGSTAPSLAACALWSRSRCVIDDGFSYSLVLSCVDHSFSFGVVLQNERLEALGDGAEGLDGISPALALLLSSELDAVGARRRVTRLRLVQVRRLSSREQNLIGDKIGRLPSSAASFMRVRRRSGQRRPAPCLAALEAAGPALRYMGCLDTEQL